MAPDADRRRFLRQLGIALAAVAAAGPPVAGCCGSAAPGPGGTTGGTTGGGGGTKPPASGWDGVRAPWRDLDRLAKAAEDSERGEKLRESLVADHRNALDGLVAAGEVTAPVAADIHVAFEEAAYHVWRSHAPISCYEPVAWPQYDIDAAANLARQAELLEQHAAGLDEATAAEARKAIERDIAFLSLDPARQQEIQRTEADGAWRALADLELEAPAESTQAAEILVQVLAGQR